MNYLITGANGYIGQALAQRLLDDSALPEHRRVTRLVLFDRQFDAPADDPRVQLIVGDITRMECVEALAQTRPDVVFHLASVASGRAETEFELGLQVNLRGSMQLFEALRQLQTAPVVVFTSTIAVFGTQMPPVMDDDTAPNPELSYGAHKRMLEILLADYSRRGFLQGRAVRLPGIVVRPAAPNGAWSVFSSTLLRSLATGQPCTMPVSPQATLWLMSLPCCIDNLLHAAAMEQPKAMVWTLPALRVAVGDIVAAFDRRTNNQASGWVTYAPLPDIQAQFGSLPPLKTPAADNAGFRHDQDIDTLIDRATAHIPKP